MIRKRIRKLFFLNEVVTAVIGFRLLLYGAGYLIWSTDAGSFCFPKVVKKIRFGNIASR